LKNASNATGTVSRSPLLFSAGAHVARFAQRRLLADPDHRQFANSTLHDLRGRGLLIKRKRNLIVADTAALESLARSR